VSYDFAPPPSTTQGDANARIAAIHRYLFKLSEQLNHALTQSDEKIKQTVVASQNAIKAAEEPLEGEYNRLKSLVIKTADIVRTEMDVLETRLASEYIAISTWGAYEESIRAHATATAREVLETFEYSSRLDALERDSVTFDSYRLSTSGYIRRGIIGYDDQSMPIIGIAIGQDLRSRTVEIGCEVLEEIDMTQNLAAYTSDRVTFWQNGVEVGSFSNSELSVTRIRVADSIGLGGLWAITRTNGFSIEWTGGE
jgi:hypothetical protein